MSLRQDARRHMASALGDQFMDPIFQLQQPALDAPPVVSAVLPPAPPAAPLASSSGPGQEDQSHDGGPDDPGHSQKAGTGGIASTQRTRFAIPPGLDTSTADLTYRRNARSFSVNNPSPEGWAYPHKKGIGTGSNLEAFKAEIEARTRRGENCKTIADALVAMGVQTSDRAVSRVRIKWGMRKRAQRKTRTPPPESEAARLSAKTKVQALRKLEITRMTQEGLSAEEIYENLTSRGMELKKGVATVLRLQSAWKLTHNEKRWVENFRHQCHKQAKAQQIQAFRDIAKELTVQDVDAWLETKMDEQAAREARHELALKMMGKHAPMNPERRKLQKPRTQAGRGRRRSNLDNAGDGGGISDSDSDADAALEDEGALDASYAPFHDRTEVDMDDDDSEDQPQDSISNVATNVFARIDPSLLQSTSAREPAPPYLAPSSAHTAAPSVPKATPSVPPCSNTNPTKSITTHSNSATPQHQDSPVTASNAPVLVLPPKEAEANRTALSTLDQYNTAAQAYKEVLQARNENKPLLGSLTGLPPSSKELEAAKRKLKEVTQAMMLNLD